jgi:molecular chaperone HscC
MGAAVQAALRAHDSAVEDLVVTDVAPFSLGIAAVARFGARHVPGLFSAIIERGTPIPVSRSERFQTVTDGQREILIEVFQGEHAMCAQNVKLGTCRVTGIKPAAAGDGVIEVRFSYDLNGILEVETTVLESSKTSVLVIEQRPGALSSKQLATAREAMKRLKFHPRESLPNRTALARADALFVELTGTQRQELSEAIGAMHAALASQDPKTIDDARERLVSLTEALRRS